MGVLNMVGFEQVTVGATPVGLNPSGRPRRALIHVVGQPIRWRADTDGTPPSGGVGQSVAAGSYIDWTDARDEYDAWSLILNVQFIRDSSATDNAVLEVSYFG